MSRNFEVLYYFENLKERVFELKFTDVSKDELIEKRFQWLYQSRESGKIIPFTFKSMERGGDLEKRTFLSGSFNFNKKFGQLTLFSDVSDLLSRDLLSLEQHFLDEVKKYLDEEDEFTNLGCEKLSYRRLCFSDLESFSSWISDPIAIKYSLSVFQEMKEERALCSWFKKTLLDENSKNFGVVDMDSKLVGYAGICKLSWLNKSGEFFIFLGDRKSWGKGVGTLVTQDVTTYALKSLELNRLMLTVSSDNLRALRVYEKSGYKLEGRLREAFLREGQFSDKIIMSVLRREL